MFNFLNVLEPYYRGGEYDYLLNSDKELDLPHKRFIVFELDNIKDNKVLFPIVTIISSSIVKGTIINNSDCKILLDQRKYVNKFDEIQALLGLTDKERAQILSINMANNPSRKYKEVWIGLGGTQSAVYATEVSLEEYYCYTTEETEKLELFRLSEKLGGNIELAIKQLAESKREK